MMNYQGDRRRSLADLPPEILSLIYSKLRASWSNELNGFKLGDQLGTARQLQSGIPSDVRKLLHNSKIIYKFKEHGWLLVHYRYRHQKIFGILSCFNPLLSWPSCFIRLPTFDILLDSDIPIAAAFSASPTADSGGRDLRILIFHGGYLFKVIRIRQAGPKQKTYWITGGSRRVPVAAEYTGVKFYVLFESGDILVWHTRGGGGRGRMLIASPPVHSTIREMNRVCAVKESLMITWSRKSSSSLFRLVSVKETQIGGDDGDQIEELEEGVQTTTYFVFKNANIKILMDGCSFSMWLFFSAMTILVVGVIITLSSKIRNFFSLIS
ncbi:hypothetical protein LINGRAHAP2_LOCUS18907 [Linum grandiflorum]